MYMDSKILQIITFLQVRISLNILTLELKLLILPTSKQKVQFSIKSKVNQFWHVPCHVQIMAQYGKIAPMCHSKIVEIMLKNVYI